MIIALALLRSPNNTHVSAYIDNIIWAKAWKWDDDDDDGERGQKW